MRKRHTSLGKHLGYTPVAEHTREPQGQAGSAVTLLKHMAHVTTLICFPWKIFLQFHCLMGKSVIQTTVVNCPLLHFTPS